MRNVEVPGQEQSQLKDAPEGTGGTSKIVGCDPFQTAQADSASAAHEVLNEIAEVTDMHKLVGCEQTFDPLVPKNYE